MMMMDDGHWGWGSWILTAGNNGGVLGAGDYRRGAARAISAVVVTADHRHDPRPGASNAEQVLAERYARGDIDDDEYKRRLGLLRQNLASTTST